MASCASARTSEKWSASSQPQKFPPKWPVIYSHMVDIWANDNIDPAIQCYLNSQLCRWASEPLGAETTDLEQAFAVRDLS